MKKLLSATLISIALAGFALSAHAQTTTVLQGARKFDEFGDYNCEDEMARLDNFAVELQQNPQARGYIVIYGGRRHKSAYNSRMLLPRRGEAEARAARIKPYLVDRRGVIRERVMMVKGGFRETWTAELWIVPPGAKPPTPTPTLQPKDVRFRRGRARARDYRCEV